MAGGISMRSEIRQRSYELEGLGIEVTSRWLYEGTGNLVKVGAKHERMAAHAVRDIADIEKANVLVYNSHLDPDYRSNGGGAHWETGYAYARDKPIFVVGHPRHVFHFLPFGDSGVRRFADWESAVQALRLYRGDVLVETESELEAVSEPGELSGTDDSPVGSGVGDSNVGESGRSRGTVIPGTGLIEKLDWIRNCEDAEKQQIAADPVGWRYMNHAGYRTCESRWVREAERRRALRDQAIVATT